jgi:hypothetical protein
MDQHTEVIYTWTVTRGVPMEGMTVLYAGPSEVEALRCAEKEHQENMDFLRWVNEDVDRDGPRVIHTMDEEIHLQQWHDGKQVSLERFQATYVPKEVSGD